MRSGLVLVISLIVVVAQAKRPPSIQNGVAILNQVLVYYHEKIDKLAELKKKIQLVTALECDASQLYQQGRRCSSEFDSKKLALKTKCVEADESRSVFVANCVTSLDQLADSLGKFQRSIPTIKEKLGEIPLEFGPIKMVMEKNLNDQLNWIGSAKGKIEAKSEDFFALNKQIIQKELERQVSDLTNRARTEVLCASLSANMNVHRQFANYYDSVHADLPKYDRLRYQTAQTLWAMELLKHQCVSEVDLVKANQFFTELSKRVEGDRFDAFKKNLCETADENLISREECLNLPLKPDALAVLNRLNRKSEVPNEKQ